MKQELAVLTLQWDSLSHHQALLFGVFSGLVTTLVPAVIFGGEAFVFGFLSLFPFWAVLCFRALSYFFRFRQIFHTKYYKFCIGWFLTFMFLAGAFSGFT